MNTQNSGPILCLFLGKEITDHLAQTVTQGNYLTDKIFFLALLPDGEVRKDCAVLSLPPMDENGARGQLEAARTRLEAMLQASSKVIFYAAGGDNLGNAVDLAVNWCAQLHIPYRVVLTMPLKVFGERPYNRAKQALSRLEQVEQRAGELPSLVNHVIDIASGSLALSEDGRVTLGDAWAFAAEEAEIITRRICAERD